MIEHDKKARLAEAILHNRVQRRSLMPVDIFGEHAWDALLMLFVADAASERLTGRRIAHSLNCGPTIMSRWVKYLAEQGLVIGDGEGDLDDLLTLSPKAIVAIEAYLENTQEYANEFSAINDTRGAA